MAGEMSRHLAVLRGALDRDETGERTTEVSALADQGTHLLGELTRYLHAEITRDDLDRAATKAWLDKGGATAGSLMASASGPPWTPNDPRTAHLAQAGTRAPGVITDVRRAGLGNARVADLTMTVTIRPSDGPTLELSRTLSIAVVQAPRIGDRVEVAYDPSDPHHFVYRPLIELPS
jgi:hypothetical protein